MVLVSVNVREKERRKKEKKTSVRLVTGGGVVEGC